MTSTERQTHAISKASCVLFLFSLEDQYSLVDYLPDMIYDVSRAVSPDCLLYLVGTKYDIKYHDITEDMIRTMEHQHECIKTFYISAKTGDGIDYMMDKIATALKEQLPSSRISTSPNYLVPAGPIRVRQNANRVNKCLCC